MNTIRYDYIDGRKVWKTFKTRRAFIEWAQDEQHTGGYYIGTPTGLIFYNRSEVLHLTREN